ncbi:MAG: hydrolase [Deltaproteobacteria bacterium]|nr:hydrolase [Deltaproteobacteria bacterium]
MRTLFPAIVVSLVAAGALALACGGDDAASPIPAEADAGSSSGSAGPDGSTSGSDATTADASGGPAGACTGKPGVAGDRTVEITVGTTKRSFDLHVPAKYDPTKATPLVLLFHGYTMNAKSIAEASKFSATADARGMIVAYPSGLNLGFNAGDCCGGSVAAKVDDVGFAREIVASIGKDYCVDTKRVFSTGFSNGGFMSYYLACEMSETFAAVASVAGTLGVSPDACKPKRPVSLLHIHGTGDTVVAYNGGGLAGNRSVATSVQAFRTIDKCPAGDGASSYSKGDVSCSKWTCEAGSHVELCTVTNGGHQWPGGETLPYGGSASPNLDSSETIAKFFEAHPL